MPTSLVTLLVLLRSLIRSRVHLQLEDLALRHQIGVLQRSLQKRSKITAKDASSGLLCRVYGVIGACPYQKSRAIAESTTYAGGGNIVTKVDLKSWQGFGEAQASTLP